MRTTTAVLLLMLLPFGLSADDSVLVGTPHVEILPSEAHLQTACGSAAARACTRFVAYRLETACVSHGSRIRMTARARFTPWILLRDLQALTHEREHIRDLEEDLTSYVDALARVAFDDRAACENAALQEDAAFADVVLRFAGESSRKRDANRGPGRIATPPSVARASRASASASARY